MVSAEIIGKIRGRGYEVACKLLVSRSEDEALAMRCAVLDAASWLPDGYYEALFSDQSAFLRRSQGVWSTGIAWAVFPPRPHSAPDHSPSADGSSRSIAA
jgi:hypothetical protein